MSWKGFKSKDGYNFWTHYKRASKAKPGTPQCAHGVAAKWAAKYCAKCRASALLEKRNKEMSELPKCPNCGAEQVATVGNVIRFACMAHFVGEEYRPSDRCKITTLENTVKELRKADAVLKKWQVMNEKREKVEWIEENIEAAGCSNDSSASGALFAAQQAFVRAQNDFEDSANSYLRASALLKIVGVALSGVTECLQLTDLQTKLDKAREALRQIIQIHETLEWPHRADAMKRLAAKTLDEVK